MVSPLVDFVESRPDVAPLVRKQSRRHTTRCDFRNLGRCLPTAYRRNQPLVRIVAPLFILSGIFAPSDIIAVLVSPLVGFVESRTDVAPFVRKKSRWRTTSCDCRHREMSSVIVALLVGNRRAASILT